jgi:hypothetical protein
MFETNSSSMHSLVILKDIDQCFPPSTNWKKEFNADNTYTIMVGRNDFGRVPLLFLAHPVDKFLYLVADRYSEYSENSADRDIFVQRMIEKLDDCSSIEFTGMNWNGHIDYGYVDHQSSGVIWSYLDREGIDAMDFIFDPKSMIVIDGDEYCAWECVKNSGLVNSDNIEFDLRADTEVWA